MRLSGVDEVFVTACDPNTPAGNFGGALDLLKAIHRYGHDFDVGISGYPESHPKISDDTTIQAMWDGEEPRADPQ